MLKFNERIIEVKMALNQKKISELIKIKTFKDLYRDINNLKIECLNFYYDPQAENNIPYEFLNQNEMNKQLKNINNFSNI